MGSRLIMVNKMRAATVGFVAQGRLLQERQRIEAKCKSKSPAVYNREDPPCITVSALSRDTSSEPVTILLPWSRPASGFDFPFVEGFAFGVAFVFLLISTKARF